MFDDEPEVWNPEGLVEHFVDVHRKNHDRRFAFVLGAGASVQSGIPAAGALVRRWLGELHRRLGRGPIERWATPETLDIPGFAYEQATASYSQVFARRFRQHPDEGYADLEDIMQGKDPSFGYSVLAHVLAETRHKLVITTNFDNLVADALSIFTATSPLVCGHESLAGFIRVVPRRPVVVKIHRDLLMAPMNLADEIAALPDPWHEPLTHVFRNYTPIVLGYGGNDGSLMGFLDALPPRSIVGGLFWCYYGPGGPPSRQIRQLVARHRGAIVPIDGFDEFMAILSSGLRIGLLDGVIESKARERVERYRRRAEELFRRPSPEPDPATDDLDEAPAGEPTDMSQETSIQDAGAQETARSSTLDDDSTDMSSPPPHHPAPPSNSPIASALSPAPPARTPPGQGPARRGIEAIHEPDPAALRSPTRSAAPPAERVLLSSGSSATRSAPAAGETPAEGRLPGVRDADGETKNLAAATGPDAPVPRDMPRSSSERRAPAPATAIAVTGPGHTGHHRFTRSPIRIGRAPDNDLVLADPAIAPAHAELRDTPEGYFLVDLESNEGTWIGAMRVPSTGVLIASPRLTARLGPYEIRVERSHDEAAGAEESPDLAADTTPPPGTPLQRALQQVAADTPDTSPWAALMQARAEPDHERSVTLLRAALERFPDHPHLLAGLAARLCERPTRAHAIEAIRLLRRLLEAKPQPFSETRTLGELSFLFMRVGDLNSAGAALRDAWARVAQSDLSPARNAEAVALVSFATGVLQRLRHRDDTAALAALKHASHLPSDSLQGPLGDLGWMVRQILTILDPPSHRLYQRIFETVRGERTLASLEQLEPRFAAIAPADPKNLDVSTII